MLRRVVGTSLLLAYLVAPVAGAASNVLPASAPRHGAARERAAPAGIPALSTLWEALASMLSRLKDRGTLDPNGVASPTSSQAGETGDARGTLDPNG